MSMETFEQVLAKFVKATTNSRDLARQCSEMAMDAFAKLGEDGEICYDLSKAQAFFDAIPKNYVRRQAYVAWLVNFGPIRLVENKLLKDKGEHANDLDVDGAKATPFWEFNPAQDPVNFGAADIIQALNGSIRKFERENYTAMNPAATAKLAEAKVAVAAIA